MTKIMIVEDDLALREIYSIRLTAEGYTIVVAGDGEEALAVAAQEKPDEYRDLVVRVAGFSAYFVEVYKASQDDLIRRTEMSV